jgi:uncharacterized repeat protein (TIGR02543 family)
MKYLPAMSKIASLSQCLNITASIYILLMAFILVSCTTESTPVYRLSTSSTPSEAGSVNPGGGEFDDGDEVQLTAAANENWTFEGWEGDAAGSQNPITISMDSDKSVTARFIRLTYPLTINIEGQGTVTETVTQPKTTNYDAETVITLEAASDTGWIFDNWQGDLQGNQNPIQISMDGPKTITASFLPKEYSVNLQSDGPGSVSVNPDRERYLYGDLVTFTATPDENVEFLGWLGTFDNKSQVVDYEITGNVEITGFFSTVENAIRVVTSGFRLEEGLVRDAIFEISNFLTESIQLVEFTVDNEDGERFATSDISEPIGIDSRTFLELTVMFESGVTDPETFELWRFNWTFSFKGESYRISQVVGEPESNNKRGDQISGSGNAAASVNIIRSE